VPLARRTSCAFIRPCLPRKLRVTRTGTGTAMAMAVRRKAGTAMVVTLTVDAAVHAPS
jgi:hypothetical protein